MLLTDPQWALLQPLLPPPSPALRGRPPLDDRLILEGILWKLRTASPWYDLPSSYPSHQTCYRRYRQWRRSGVLRAIFQALLVDLRQRGGLDLQQAFKDGTFRFVYLRGRPGLVHHPSWDGAWQLSTALLLLAVLVKRPSLPAGKASSAWLSYPVV